MEQLNSAQYWENRYANGGNSGVGSYAELAEFKAGVINKFVSDNNIPTVIEFGCGNGNQLIYANYPIYVGFDVSPTAVKLCRRIFEKDLSKRFALMDIYCGETADLILSLDVVYHLVEDDVYESYMNTLFNASSRFVIIYSSDYEKEQVNHERRRTFSTWVEKNRPEYKLIHKVEGINKEMSYSDFYIYERTNGKRNS